MSEENVNNSVECEGCASCSSDVINSLEESLQETSKRYVDLMNKFKALQDEYNKVCSHRDILFEILNKMLM